MKPIGDSILYSMDTEIVYLTIKTLIDVANPISERVWVTPIHILNCPIGVSNKFAMKFAAFVRGDLRRDSGVLPVHD